MTERSSGVAARSRAWVPAAIILLYLGALGVLALTGHFGFIFKTAIVPVLFLVAMATRRFKVFICDWAVFLSLIVLFDALRGLVYSVTTKLGLRVYMGYAIAAERALFGEVPTVTLQRAWYRPPTIGLLDKTAVIIHASHFVVFFFFALAIWAWRHEDFGRFKLGMLLTLGAGLLLYFVVPTVPPWMASGTFSALPPIAPIRSSLYSFSVPTLQRAFDVNPIAAMPSLHTAFPAFFACVALWHFGWRGVPALVYLAGVVLSLVYLGEHYIVDELAGIAVAGLAFVVAYKTELFRRPAAAAPTAANAPGRAPATMATSAAAPPARFGWNDRALRLPVLLSLLIVLGSEVVGRASLMLRGGFPLTQDFIERELVGKTPFGHYLAGIEYLVQGHRRRALQAFDRALGELPAGKQHAQARSLLGRTAFELGEFARAIRALEPAPGVRLAAEDARVLALACAEAGQRARALPLLSKLRQRLPADPDVLFWLTFARFEQRSIDRVEVARAATELAQLPGGKGRAALLARRLRSLLAPPR
ncbi:MAG: phosphatase PAP2 family protein [Proteobacteria bacterium]|nr:phosphatase PAP2 family protein [Pseudomonadota bacterium]